MARIFGTFLTQSFINIKTSLSRCNTVWDESNVVLPARNFSKHKKIQLLRTDGVAGLPPNLYAPFSTGLWWNYYRSTNHPLLTTDKPENLRVTVHTLFFLIWIWQHRFEVDFNSLSRYGSISTQTHCIVDIPTPQKRLECQQPTHAWRLLCERPLRHQPHNEYSHLLN